MVHGRLLSANLLLSLLHLVFHHIGSNWNIHAPVKWNGMKFNTDTWGPQMINSTEFGDPLIFPLVPRWYWQVGQSKLVNNYWMDSSEICYRDIQCPRRIYFKDCVDMDFSYSAASFLILITFFNSVLWFVTCPACYVATTVGYRCVTSYHLLPLKIICGLLLCTW